VGEALRMAGFKGMLKVAEQDTPTQLMDVAELRRRLGPDQLTLV
jgi:hypothetical protein